MITVGITGNFSTGKSTVTQMFQRLGATIVDADAIGHVLLEADEAVRAQVVKTFGADIKNYDGSIDRGKLAEIVFNDKRALRRLGAITHPVIIRKIKKEINAKKHCAGILVVDAPLLYEVGIGNLFDWVVVVSASRVVQIKRGVYGRRLSEYQVRQRIKAQFPLSIKKRMADFIIDNDGTKESTKKQVRGIWRMLKSQKQ